MITPSSEQLTTCTRVYREKKKSIPEELTPEEVREVMDALREMGTGKEGKP